MATPKGKALLIKAILGLLSLGVLTYAFLPMAVCDLETDKDGNPKIVRYIYLSDSRKTATVVFSNDEGGWNIADDRCQKGMVYGEWQPLKEIPQKECPECVCKPMVIGYVTNCETGETDKYFCDKIGEGANCNKNQDLLMPFPVHHPFLASVIRNIPSTFIIGKNNSCGFP